MVRLFNRSAKRKVSTLDGLWKFKIDPECKGVLEKWYENFPEDGMEAIVPSCWNNELGLYEYEGLAWYKTTFTTTKANVNLLFHAVTGQAEVYLDGKHLGGHYGGFTGFNFVVENLSAGEHTLVVAVDNTHDDLNTIPLAKVDWFHYGGITRSVELMELDEVWICDCRIDYVLDRERKNAQVQFAVELENLSGKKQERQLSIYAGEEKVYSASVVVEGCITVKTDPVEMKDIKLWDISQPNLYYFRFEIEEDDLIERTGFRTIKAENRKILLNGREIYLQGVNRHEDHPDWGFAMPLKLMKKDMDIIKNLGCNAIRGSHYPNAKAFLDYCDQEGVLFFEEMPMWQYFEVHFKNPLIHERGLKMLEEMVKRDYHHPSIIIWSVHNEIATEHPLAFDLTKEFVDKVRSIDTTRLISYASSHTLEDICFSLVDVICVNKYFGWYVGELEAWHAFLKDLKEKLERKGLGDKPIIMSEFGAAGIYGDSTFEAPKWTENYQEKYLEYTLKLFKEDPDISGAYIWQYCDIRSAKELALGRARSFNNKGIVNEYRKPKMAYWMVQRIFKASENKENQ